MAKGPLVRAAALIPLWTLASGAYGAPAKSLHDYRALFKDNYRLAERGAAEALPVAEALEGYVLAPDFYGRYLRATAAEQPLEVVKAFARSHREHPEARLILNRKLSALAGAGRWREFLALWQDFPPGTPSTALRCHRVNALIKTGTEAAQAEREGLDLWLAPRSQPKACDPAFATLKARGVLGSSQFRARLELALDADQFQLARYLARSLPAADRARTDLWHQVRRNPGKALIATPVPALAQEPQLVEKSLLSLASRDPDQARAAFARVGSLAGLPADLAQAVERNAALGQARRHEPGAAAELLALSTPNAATRAWALRSALRDGDWPLVLAALEALPDEQALEPAMRYWSARAELERENASLAQQIFAGLAQERGYFGFLAADRLGLPYALKQRRTRADDAKLRQLEGLADLKRARELFEVGLYGRARKLWADLIHPLPQEDQAQAALLALRWGWYSRAIATANRAGLADDLQLRYPIPNARWLSHVTIEPALAVGIARNESLFMPDVRSSAGAIGLMQLMPATGREVARSLQMPYRGLRTLIDPESNARLGSTYLRSMLDRFDQHVALAAAAYNAGPHRVERWLPEEGPLAADIWVETIPFNETRNYVRRVMEATAIFSLRQQKSWRLQPNLTPVPPGNPRISAVR